MAMEHGQSQDMDLDRTDRLPILEGVPFDPEFDDDAVRMDQGSSNPGASLVSSGATNEFIRSSPLDLPSLAESMRSVEVRIERQNAEYEALSRSFERARDAEAAATARANSLAKDLAAARAALESEQSRLRENERAMAEKGGSIEAARSRAEEAKLESERHQSESRTLRDSLATRDATIVQVLHSLGERDAQLAALQLQHANVLPALEARANNAAQLEVDLTTAQAQVNAIAVELKTSQATTAALSAQLKRGESEVSITRLDLAAVKKQAGSYLELLRTRDWLKGFHLNLFRELDAKLGAADTGRDALQSERDQLHGQVVSLEARIAVQNAAIEKLQSTAATHASALAQQANDLTQGEQAREGWVAKLAAAEAERTHLRAELAVRDQALAEALTSASGEVQRAAQLQTEHAAQLSELRSDAETSEQEIAVLVAHLQEARRPIESIEADLKRLREELAAKTAAMAELAEEGKQLRATLERTRGALEEREFLIRRLERSESNNANALGRIQTSMERLGSVPTLGPAAAITTQLSAELVRIDGDRSITHALGRRTRIGRAPSCELQIDSSSVSRHHALVLVGPREAIIEDLNSTNGVNVNGRMVTRHLLIDGDLITVGEIQFRYVAKTAEPDPKG
jgi:chromosome segregation ATPase